MTLTSKAKNILKLYEADVVDPEDYDLEDAVSHRRIVDMNVSDIATSQMVVAVCDAPSWGVGGELVIAASIGKPVFIAYPKGMKLSAWVMRFPIFTSVKEMADEMVKTWHRW